MGGRGRRSRVDRQITIDDVQKRRVISDIVRESEQRRNAIGDVVGLGAIKSDGYTLFKKCYCCGGHTIPIGSENATCPLCGWIDDQYQNSHPDSIVGENPISLTQAREIYRRKL